MSGRGTLAHLVLPAITLGAPLAAVLARMTRASVLEELRELYVLAARARGVSRARAVLKHAFRNSLIPIVTVLGLQFGAVLTGAVITETIFAWPGVGRLLDPVDQLPRLPAGAGLHPADRRHLRVDEPAGRRRLRVSRSADPV